MKYSHSHNLMRLNIINTDFYEAKILDDRSITTDKTRTKISPRYRVNVFTQYKYIASLKKLAGTRFCARYRPFNFASVHGLTPVTVHMSLSLPRGNFERRVTRCTTPGNPPCRGNFSPCEQNAKVAPGQE